jgi:hypothetical protein
MATHPDFWGEIAPATVRTPLGILREQAALLGEKTNGVIEATVDTTVFLGEFRHSFTLVVPALDDYRYALFSVRHGIDLYPVDVSFPTARLGSEDEFTDWLRQRLSSPETRKIVANLLAQAST